MLSKWTETVVKEAPTKECEDEGISPPVPEEDVLLSASLSSSSVSTSSSPDASESELALEADSEATSKSEA